MAFKTTDIAIVADGADTVPYSSRKVLVTVKAVDLAEIIDKMDIKDVIEHYGTKLLDAIGEERCTEYFDLIYPEDNQ